MNDNATPHPANEYDQKAAASIPLYEWLHQSTIDLVNAMDKPIAKWLDTGCGTGNFCMRAKKIFTGADFILADPSPTMLAIAKEKLETAQKVSFVVADTQSLNYQDDFFDVITAIQCHHYLDRLARAQAVQNCFRMLKRGGVLIVFENIAPFTEQGKEIGLQRWVNYQIGMGKTAIEAKEHIKRFGQEFFPISVYDHLNLLDETGFSAVEILWFSYLQAGFYALK